MKSDPGKDPFDRVVGGVEDDRVELLRHRPLERFLLDREIVRRWDIQPGGEYVFNNLGIALFSASQFRYTIDIQEEQVGYNIQSILLLPEFFLNE